MCTADCCMKEVKINKERQGMTHWKKMWYWCCVICNGLWKTVFLMGPFRPLLYLFSFFSNHSYIIKLKVSAGFKLLLSVECEHADNHHHFTRFTLWVNTILQIIICCLLFLQSVNLVTTISAPNRYTCRDGIHVPT